MNKQQIDYLLKNYKTRSVKQLAEELKLDHKEVQRGLRRILAQRESLQEKPPSKAISSFSPKPWFHVPVVGFILVFAFFLYSKTLSYPFLNWDDPHYVTENLLIRNFSKENLTGMFSQTRFGLGLYIPLTQISYALDYKFSHFNPRGYRLTNLILHLANIALVYALVNLFTGEWLVAIAVALVFACHPVQIESIVWIAERKSLLSAFFFFLALLSYAMGRLKNKENWISLSATAIFFLAACLSKPNVVILPLLLILFDRSYAYWKEKKWGRYLPFFLGALIISMITFHITKGENKSHYFGGSFGSTMLAMTVAMMKYMELLFFPARQSLVYEFPVYGSFADPQPALSFLGILLMIGGLLYLRSKDKKLFFWGAWYFILLSPVMNFIPFPSLMNDRYLYLPLIGIFTLLFLLARRFAGLTVTGVLILASVLGFSFLNLKRQPAWANSETLWSGTQSKKAGHHLSTYMNLADTYLEKGELDKAIGEFEKVLQMSEEPMAYCGLGIVYHQKGDFEKAIEYYKKGITKLSQDNTPREAAALHNSLALSYKAQGKFDLAIQELKQAIMVYPTDPKFSINVGNIYRAMGKDSEAEAAYRQSLAVDPDFPDGLYSLGLFYHDKGEVEKARKPWSHLLEVDPNYRDAAAVKSKLAGNNR